MTTTLQRFDDSKLVLRGYPSIHVGIIDFSVKFIIGKLSDLLTAHGDAVGRNHTKLLRNRFSCRLMISCYHDRLDAGFAAFGDRFPHFFARRIDHAR
ncbi:hypothetical protein D3C85_1475610 [compost metagenome]